MPITLGRSLQAQGYTDMANTAGVAIQADNLATKGADINRSPGIVQ